MKKNKIFTTNGVSFAMIAVQGGTYTMGALDNDPDAYVWEKEAGVYGDGDGEALAGLDAAA